MSQPDGGYPRLNGAMLKTGQFNSMIVSMVGKFTSPPSGTTIEFTCCDGEKVVIGLEHSDPPDIDENSDMAFEIIGQAQDEHNVAMFVHRPLSNDMDMALYNKTIEIVHDKKFSDYFGSLSTPSLMTN